MLCVAANDGHKLWSANYTRDFGAVFIGEKGNAPGATRHGNNGAPWVEGGWLFASAGSTNGAAVVAFDPATGAVRWKGGNEIAAYAAPMVATIEGTRLVICGTTWCNPAFSGGKLYLRDGIKTGGSWLCVDLSR